MTSVLLEFVGKACNVKRGDHLIVPMDIFLGTTESCSELRAIVTKNVERLANEKYLSEKIHLSISNDQEKNKSWAKKNFDSCCLPTGKTDAITDYVRYICGLVELHQWYSLYCEINHCATIIGSRKIRTIVRYMIERSCKKGDIEYSEMCSILGELRIIPRPNGLATENLSYFYMTVINSGDYETADLPVSPEPVNYDPIQFISLEECILIQNSVSSLQQKINTRMKLECPICMNEEEEVVKTSIHDDDLGKLHPFVCQTCLDMLLVSNKCPFCRMSLDSGGP